MADDKRRSAMGVTAHNERFCFSSVSTKPIIFIGESKDTTVEADGNSRLADHPRGREGFVTGLSDDACASAHEHKKNHLGSVAACFAIGADE